MTEYGVPQPNVPQPAYAPQFAGPPAGVDPLDLPYPGAGPVLAVKRFFQNYAKFSGRASRSEFWWVQLVFIVVYVVLGGFGLALGSASSVQRPDGNYEPGPAFIPFAVLLVIISLASIVPNIALTVRRLHDANMPGLLYLITFFPYLGSFVLLILNIFPSKPEGAVYDRYRSTQQVAPYAPAEPQSPPAPPVV